MLDRMIESQNNPAENSRRGNFLLTTMFLVAMTLGGAMLYSLYAKSLGDMNENLEFSSVVAPIAETEPPPVEAIKPETKTASISKAPTETVRVVNQKAINESPDIPIGVSVVKNQYASRPQGRFTLGETDSTAVDPSGSGTSREGNNNSVGISSTPKQIVEDEDVKEPPKMPKVEPKTPPTPQRPVSLGVANGVAKSLPVPVYPAPAKAVGAKGTVNVQILIDESGKVISAKAVSGNPLLRQAAEQAAQRAVFSPTKLSNVPVKATGIIVYNFIGQ